MPQLLAFSADLFGPHSACSMLVGAAWTSDVWAFASPLPCLHVHMCSQGQCCSQETGFHSDEHLLTHLGAVLLHKNITDADNICTMLHTLHFGARLYGSKYREHVLAGAKEELRPTAERGQQKAYETAGVAQDKAKSAGNALAANFSMLGGEALSGVDCRSQAVPRCCCSSLDSAAHYMLGPQHLGGLRHS